MRVLVTGATGFLGSYLVPRLLQQGNLVRALARKTSTTDHLQQVEIVYGDLKDHLSLERAVAGVDVVYHAAAATRGGWEEYREGTVKGTERLLGLALEAGVQRFVHISSLAVYQVSGIQRNALVDEDSPYEHHAERSGPYTYAKVESEKLVFDYARRGLPVAVIRPGIIYGPRGRIFFPHVGRPINKKLFVMIGKGNNLLPLTYIDNTVDAIVLASTREEALGRAFNIVDDGQITQLDYLQAYMAATGTTWLTLPIPFSLQLSSTVPLMYLKKAGVLRNAHLPSKYSLVSKWNSLRYDTTRAKQQLGWQPKVSLEEGLRRTFEWHATHELRQAYA